MLLLALPLLAASQHPVAVLRSGDRVPCRPGTAVGSFLIETPWGRLAGAADPVVEVVDPAAEIELLRPIRASDPAAWVGRLAERGLVGPLVAEADRDNLDPDQRERVLAALEGWGRR
ncbi:MAG: hypothetical protein D6702_07070, partial [Planctomycetota bacterium]